MDEEDYTLFSYFWFFRLETFIFFASLIAVVVFIIIKFIANRVTDGFGITIMPPAQAASDDVLTRQQYVFRTIQYSMVLFFIGLALLIDTSGQRVFRGASKDVQKKYFETR